MVSVNCSSEILLTAERFWINIIEAFAGKKFTILVCYTAINLMNKYCHIEYFCSQHRAVYNNSHTLSLVLSEEPSYVISADLFTRPDLVRMLDEAPANIVLTDLKLVFMNNPV